MFEADRPIFTSEQDRLGRATFAKYLARCILDHQNPESLVIGLNGGWGVGKTSVINLMLEELDYASNNMFDDQKPIILNFSPWSYSGQNQLIYNFFRRLSSAISAADYFESSRNIVFLLELYISFFTNKALPPFCSTKTTLLQKLLNPSLWRGEKIAWESGRDLTQVKSELNLLLSLQQHKLIIIIDNISRLDKVEIKQIFQIIKSIGNFSNTVYVVALDKKHIAEVLDQTNENGIEFLDKVIQLPFSIPPICQQDLEEIFIDRLKQVVSQVPQGAWDRHYWADLYYSSLKNIFKNVRHISRYLNTLSFSYEHVKDVVNAVDFFAITVLEVFCPQVYAGIRDNKDLFTDLMDNVYELNAIKIAEDTVRCNEILKRSDEISREQLLKLLMRLFPRLRHLYQHKITFIHSEMTARKDKRICDPDTFDVYFRLSMPSGIISPAEMQAILSIVDDEEGFALALLRLNKDEKIIKFLDLLDSNGVTVISPDHIPNMVAALMDSADLFPEGESSLVSFTTPMRIHRIFQQLLARVESSEKKFQIYRNAIKKAVNSLYIITHELSLLSYNEYINDDSALNEQINLNATQLDKLNKLALEKIIIWADSGRLIEHPKLLFILYEWKARDAQACEHYVEQVIQDEVGILAFLQATLHFPIQQAETKLQKNPQWRESLKNIEAFIPIEKLEPHAKAIFESPDFEKLREREQLAILIFLDLTDVKTLKILPQVT